VRKFFDLPLESADLVTKDDMTLATNDNHISHDLALQDQLHWGTTYHSCLVLVFDMAIPARPETNGVLRGRKLGQRAAGRCILPQFREAKIQQLRATILKSVISPCRRSS
jgi:hypothetical protein